MNRTDQILFQTCAYYIVFNIDIYNIYNNTRDKGRKKRKQVEVII